MDCLKVRQLVVVRIDADTEEQTSVASVYNLVVPKLERHVISVVILFQTGVLER
jgi:hypothetical protein